MVEVTKELIIGMDNIPKLGIQRFTGGESLEINRLCKNNEGLVEQLIDQFSKLLKENHTVHDLEVEIESKPDHNRVQQRDAEYPYIYKKP